MTELLSRIKEASLNETMHKISTDLQKSMVIYQLLLQQGHYTSSADPLVYDKETRKYFFQILDKEIKKMNHMLNNERIILSFDQNHSKNLKDSELIRLHYRELARRVDIERSYDPPGELSKNGKRHDNDFEDISKISIIPTEEEILCERSPFLPSVLPDAPHFLPDGAARLLDTQFRLLRENILNPIHEGIQNFLAALSK